VFKFLKNSNSNKKAQDSGKWSNFGLKNEEAKRKQKTLVRKWVNKWESCVKKSEDNTHVMGQWYCVSVIRY